jgi:hypothetical protein
MGSTRPHAPRVTGHSLSSRHAFLLALGCQRFRAFCVPTPLVGKPPKKLSLSFRAERGICFSLCITGHGTRATGHGLSPFAVPSGAFLRALCVNPSDSRRPPRPLRASLRALCVIAFLFPCSLLGSRGTANPGCAPSASTKPNSLCRAPTLPAQPLFSTRFVGRGFNRDIKSEKPEGL